LGTTGVGAVQHKTRGKLRWGLQRKLVSLLKRNNWQRKARALGQEKINPNDVGSIAPVGCLSNGLKHEDILI